MTQKLKLYFSLLRGYTGYKLYCTSNTRLAYSEVSFSLRIILQYLSIPALLNVISNYVKSIRISFTLKICNLLKIKHIIVYTVQMRPP